MAEYIIQKAVNMDAVKKKLQRHMDYYRNHYEAQPKKDGCCAVITLTAEGVYYGQSRTGEVYPSLLPAARFLCDKLFPQVAAHGGLVLIGEAWWPGKDQFSLISGEFRRGRESDILGLVVNDCLTAQEFADGQSDEGYETRMARIPASFGHNLYGVTRRFGAGSYGDPQAMCNSMVEQGGYDGLILRDPYGTWTRGNGATGEIIKIKRSLSFDLRVTGVYEGAGKNVGRAGAIGVSFRGRELRVNAGTDAQRHEWFDNPDSIIGQIVEIEAMDYSSEGLLREPRFKGVRHDKLAPDA